MVFSLYCQLHLFWCVSTGMHGAPEVRQEISSSKSIVVPYLHSSTMFRYACHAVDSPPTKAVSSDCPWQNNRSPPPRLPTAAFSQLPLPQCLHNYGEQPGHCLFDRNKMRQHLLNPNPISTGVDALLGAIYCNNEYKYSQVKLYEAQGTLKQCERCVEICYVLICQ